MSLLDFDRSDARACAFWLFVSMSLCVCVCVLCVGCLWARLFGWASFFSGQQQFSITGLYNITLCALCMCAQYAHQHTWGQSLVLNSAVYFLMFLRSFWSAKNRHLNCEAMKHVHIVLWVFTKVWTLKAVNLFAITEGTICWWLASNFSIRNQSGIIS